MLLLVRDEDLLKDLGGHADDVGLVLVDVSGLQVVQLLL